GQEARADEAIEGELILGEEAGYHFGLPRRRARPDRLVGLLRALFRLVGGRAVGEILASEPSRDPLARLVLSLASHPHGVRAHVGDEADGALVAQLDTLVELLGEHHGLACREMELAARLLLGGGGDEGRGGGFRRRSPRVTLFTFHCAPWSPVMTAIVSASDGRFAFSPFTSRRVAVNSGGFFPLSRAWSDQYSVGTKAWISRSRSVMRRTATDCTRPADSPRRIFSHRSGESL